MSVLDEISEHIIVAGTLGSFPISHIRSDLTVVKDFSHDGLHIDYYIAESEVLAFFEINYINLRQ